MTKKHPLDSRLMVKCRLSFKHVSVSTCRICEYYSKVKDVECCSYERAQDWFNKTKSLAKKTVKATKKAVKTIQDLEA